MKKISIKPRPILSPMPIQMIGTYNEDGSANLMNAAWGGILDEDLLILSFDRTHKTVANLEREQCFSLGLPSVNELADCDYVGLVSGNKKKDKLANTKLTCIEGESVHAPVIEEFPITFMCKVYKIIDNDDGYYVLGKVVEILVNDDCMENGKMDLEKMNLAFFCPIDNSYRAFGEKKGDAFRIGKR